MNIIVRSGDELVDAGEDLGRSVDEGVRSDQRNRLGDVQTVLPVVIPRSSPVQLQRGARQPGGVVPAISVS